MLDTILKTVKEELSAKLIVLGVHPDKNKQIISLAKTTVFSHIQNHSNVYTIQATKDFFNNTTPLETRHLVQCMMLEYKKNLIERMMLLEKSADSISRFIIPFILAQVSHKINRNPDALKSLLEGKGIFQRLRFNRISVFNF